MGRMMVHHAGSGSSWSAMDVLRVSLEGHGIVGFVEVGSSTSLAEARSKITAEVEGLTSISGNMFTFLLPDDVPVSRKQEAQILAREFLPMIQLRENGNSSSDSADSKALAETFATPLKNAKATNITAQASPLSTYKLSQYAQHFQNVSRSIPRDGRYLSTKTSVNFLGEQYSIWVTEQYTFSQLRREAARYFGCNPEHVVLVDEDGCSWPETGLVRAVHDLGMLKDKHIMLVRKPCVRGNGPEEQQGSQNQYSYDYNGMYSPSGGSPTNIVINNMVQQNNANMGSPTHNNELPPCSSKTPVSPPTETSFEAERKYGSAKIKHRPGLQLGNQQRSNPQTLSPLGGSFTSVTTSPRSPRSIKTTRRRQEQQQRPRTPKPDEMNASPAGKSVLERYADLWRVFVFYCVQIDSNRPFSMDLRGFLGLLHDCQLVDNSALSPAIINLVFASSSKDGKQMSFDNFLDSLMDITRRLHERVDKARGISPPRQRNTQALMTSFAQLVNNHVLPLTASFNVNKWERESLFNQSDGLLNLVRRFVKPLYEMFRFYAPAVESNRMDVDDDLCFVFKTFQVFAQDFKLIEIGVRHQLAELFVCACQTEGIKVGSRRNRLKIETAEDIRARLHRESTAVVAAEAAAAAKDSVLARELREDSEDSEDSEADDGRFTAKLPPKNSFNSHVQQNQQQQQVNKGLFVLLNRRDGSPVWDRPVLFFGQFLDALLRVAYTAFSQHILAGHPEQAFKALIQHLAKRLRHSSVLQILTKRRNIGAEPLGLMQASNELFKHYTDMWKADGQPDYASQKIADGPKKSAVKPNHRELMSPPASPRVMASVAANERPVRTPPASAFTNKRAGGGRRVLEKLLAAECANCNTEEQDHSSNRTVRSSPPSPNVKRAVSALLDIGPRPGQPAYVMDGDITRFGFLEDFETHSLEAEGTLISKELAHIKGHSFYDDNQFDEESKKFGGSHLSPRDSINCINENEYGTDINESTSESESHVIDTSRSEMDEESKCLEDSSLNNNVDRCDAMNRGQRAGNDMHNIETMHKEMHIRSNNLAGVLDKHTYTMLCRGGVFLKHCRRKEPHKRFVWCDENLEKVYWTPFEKRPTMDKNGKISSKVKAKSMLLTEVKSVLIGLSRQAEHNKLKRSTFSWGVKILFPSMRSRNRSSSSSLRLEIDALCFSLVSKGRSLDLEGDSTEVRDQWVAAFKQLVHAH